MDHELMNRWRSRAQERLAQIREMEERIKKLEAANIFLLVEAQRQAAEARIWEYRCKQSLTLNKIPGCNEV